MTVISPLYDTYVNEVRSKLQKDLNISNLMNVPKIEKICVNVGMGSYLQKVGKKDHTFVEKNIEAITGRKPVIRKAKLSVSNFKLREGNPVGVSVTLRGKEAYNFLHKLIHITYPRVRDFRGVSRNIFDANANISLGFADHTVFPEGVQPEDSKHIHGLQVTIVTSTKDKKQSEALLEALQFPFKKK